MFPKIDSAWQGANMKQYTDGFVTREAERHVTQLHAGDSSAGNF